MVEVGRGVTVVGWLEGAAEEGAKKDEGLG